MPPKGTSITVLEDVLTTGGSALKVVNKLREFGYRVQRVVTLVDRKEGGIDLMSNNRIQLRGVYIPEDFDDDE